MKLLDKFIKIKILLFILIILNSISLADDQNVSEILEKIQRDIKTLEKAVYSSSLELNNNNQISNSNLNANSEDVLTRHLLKLSDIESQFQKLTNRFEEINFKLDKLSNRLSKSSSR